MRGGQAILIFGAAVLLTGCDRGLAACETATRSGLARPESYERIEVEEEPSVTPAVTYYVIEYEESDPQGRRSRERVHCAYWRDTGEAEPRPIGTSSAGD